MSRRPIPVILLGTLLLFSPGFALAQATGFTFDRVVDILYNLIRTLLTAASILAGLYMVWAGISLMISGGQSGGDYKKAKDRLTWAIVGFAVAIGATIIIATIRSAVEALKR